MLLFMSEIILQRDKVSGSLTLIVFFRSRPLSISVFQNRYRSWSVMFGTFNLLQVKILDCFWYTCHIPRWRTKSPDSWQRPPTPRCGSEIPRFLKVQWKKNENHQFYQYVNAQFTCFQLIAWSDVSIETASLLD